MISEKLRHELITARTRGRRQYEIARRARLHPSTVSALVHNAIPVHPNDRRVIAIGRVLGLKAADCFDQQGEPPMGIH